MPQSFVPNTNTTNFTRDFNKELANPLVPKPLKPPVGGFPAPQLGGAQPTGATRPRTATFSELLSPSTRAPFDITKSNLFQQSAQATGQQLQGQLPGQKQAETIGLENLKVAQAKRSKDIREGLTKQGFRDTGKFLEEGVIGTAQQDFREREGLQRQLLADRAQRSQQTVASGQQSAQNLMGLVQQGKLSQEQSQAQIDLTSLQGKIASGQQMSDLEYKASKEALDRAHDVAVQKNDIKAKRDIEIMHDALAMSKIASVENMAQLDNASKLAVTELQGKINQGLQVNDQDYKLAENALDRALKLAVQNNDTATALKLQGMKDEISKLGLASGEKIAMANITAKENLALLDIGAKENIVQLQGKIQEGLLISDAELKATEAELDRVLKLALQKGDTATALKLQEMKDSVNKLGLASSEKVAFAKIASDENMALFDRETQAGLLELKDKLESGQLLNKQDFSKEMTAIDQAHKLAVQENDQVGAEKLQTMKGDLQKVILSKQQEYATAERVATQSWQSTEALSERDFEAAQKYLDKEHTIAVQENNFGQQTKIATAKAMLDLKMQTNNMTHVEKMTMLESQLEEHKADNDIERQKIIMTFAQNQEFNKMEKELGIKQALLNIEADLDMSVKNNDYEHSKILLNIKYMEENKLQKDKLLFEEKKLSLQEAGVDMAKIEKQYDWLLNEIANGRLEPGVATKFLEGALKGQLPDGFKFEDADPLAVQKAIEADLLLEKMQYASTFGDTNKDGKYEEGVYDKDGKFTGLSPQALVGFIQFMKATKYGAGGGSGGKILNVGEKEDTGFVSDAEKVITPSGGIVMG